MSNQKTTQLTPMTPNEVASGDLIPIVDVSATSSPTGESKHIAAGNLGVYLADIISPSYAPYQVANGLWFDENVSGSSLDTVCYSPNTTIAVTDCSISIRGMFPASQSVVDTSHRVIFGIGTDPLNSAESANSAYIGKSGNDLVGYIHGATYAWQASIPDFFTNYADKSTHVMLVNLSDTPYLYVNGALASTILSGSGAVGTISATNVIMGQSRSTNNVAGVIYEGQIWNRALNISGSTELFFGGSRRDSSLISSYIPNTLNPEPSQWLDSVGTNHLLLPTSGMKVTNPRKEFNLRFAVTSSGYLGNGNDRDVLPENYILTNATVSSSAKPLITLGSDITSPVTGSSGTGSFYNNRVAWVSASYGINVLDILSLGAAHEDRKLFVSMSGDNVCSFDLQGYIRN